MKTSTKRTIRTVLQSAVGLAAVLPAIVHATGLSETLPWVGGALAVAGGLTRVMAIPGVEKALDRVGLGLDQGASARE